MANENKDVIRVEAAEASISIKEKQNAYATDTFRIAHNFTGVGLKYYSADDQNATYTGTREIRNTNTQLTLAYNGTENSTFTTNISGELIISNTANTIYLSPEGLGCTGGTTIVEGLLQVTTASSQSGTVIVDESNEVPLVRAQSNVGGLFQLSRIDTVTDGENLGSVLFDFGSGSNEGAKIWSEAVGASEDSADLVLGVNGGGGPTVDEKMRIEPGGITFGAAGDSNTINGDLTVSDSSIASVTVENTGDMRAFVSVDSDRASENDICGEYDFKWNNNVIATIQGRAGADTVNKDEGYLRLRTYDEGVLGTGLTITSSDLVGINETSPDAKLHVTEDTASDSYQTALVLRRNSSVDMTNGSGPGMDFVWQDNTAGPFTYGRIAGVQTQGGSNTDGSLDFYTLDAGVLAKKATIDDGGRLGIGTDSPGTDIDILSDTPSLRVRTTGTNDVDFVMNCNPTTQDAIISAITSQWDGNSVARIDVLTGADTTNKDDGYMKFLTSQGGVLSERMRILQGGNVAIGTSFNAANLLSVISSTDASIRVENTGNDSAIIELSGDRTTTGQYLGQIDFYEDTTLVSQFASVKNTGATNAHFEFWPSSDGGGGVEKEMDIYAGGVSIGHDWNGNYKLEVGGSSNYLGVEDDGTLVLEGDATVWEDVNIHIPLVDPGLFGSALDFGPWDSTNIDCTYFEGSGTGTEEYSEWREYPHNGKEDSDIQFHIHGATPDTATSNIKISLEYIIKSGTTTRASGTVSTTFAAGSGAWEEQRINIGSAVGSSSIKIGDQIGMRVFRDAGDAADVNTADFYCTTFGFHYEIDTMGSRQITSK